jgi:hypothetical protein
MLELEDTNSFHWEKEQDNRRRKKERFVAFVFFFETNQAGELPIILIKKKWFGSD